MTEVNKTLYITLYGKAAVSRMGIILDDKKAEEIWEKEGFELHGKAKSKWLTYYMAMRSRVFDDAVMDQLQKAPNSTVLHIGCGMDSRILRVGENAQKWYDVDFPEVIEERKKYYTQSENYHMLGADASKTQWLSDIPENGNAIVILEGISMYLPLESIKNLFAALQQHFSNVYCIMDVYTQFAVKASKYKNPIKDVGASASTGIDDPKGVLTNENMHFISQLSLTPQGLIDMLPKSDRGFFKTVLGGKMSDRIYKLYTYKLNK